MIPLFGVKARHSLVISLFGDILLLSHVPTRTPSSKSLLPKCIVALRFSTCTDAVTQVKSDKRTHFPKSLITITKHSYSKSIVFFLYKLESFHSVNQSNSQWESRLYNNFDDDMIPYPYFRSSFQKSS